MKGLTQRIEAIEQVLRGRHPHEREELYRRTYRALREMALLSGPDAEQDIEQRFVDEYGTEQEFIAERKRIGGEQ